MMTMQEVFKTKKLFVLDMDGTFYLSNRLFEGSKEFLKAVREAGKDFVFFTNNSSKDRYSYIEKLKKLGVNITENDILTSGDVMIDYLNKHYKGKSVYLLGTPLLEQSFKDSGISLVTENPDLVVLGFDMTLTYDKLATACTYIRNGVEFLCTHPDVNCPVENGYIPDCGAMIELIYASTGKKPKIVGKPNIETVEAVLTLKNVQPEEVVFVGDRLATDIAIGFNHGLTSALVLTGATTKQEAEVSKIKPTFIFDKLPDIANYF